MDEKRNGLAAKDETLDDLILGDLKLIQAQTGYRFSLDAVLLAHFPDLHKVNTIVDLGTGNGIIALLISLRSSSAKITGIDIQPSMVERARRSIKYNHLEDRIKILQADIKEIARILPQGFADLIVSNPPFWRKGEGRVSKNNEEAIARHEIDVNLEQVITAAGSILCSGGKLCIIQRADRMAEVMELFARNKLALKRMRMVHAFRNREAKHLLIEGQKNGHGGFTILPPLIIYEKAGEYSAEIKALYKGKR